MRLLLLLVLCFSAVWARKAPTCKESECKIENNCRCSSTKNPLSNSGSAPQLLAISVSESVVASVFDNVQKLLFDRKNPDGELVGATFYVNHEYTDYELVQKLYNRGFEIGSLSITKNSTQIYWEKASEQDLVDEFLGQRQILSHFANIPIDDIIGARTPQLILQGDVSINAYIKSGIQYDNSWPTLSTKSLFPYTLDFLSSQQCSAGKICPVESHPGFWMVPLTNIHGNGTECNALAACALEGTSQAIADWLVGEVKRVRNGNRAPLVLRLDSYWFSFTETSFEGFRLFLDAIVELGDVFLVSEKEIIDWVKEPVEAKDFKTAVYDRKAECEHVTCALKNEQGQERYMVSCVECPRVYPWIGNPLGE